MSGFYHSSSDWIAIATLLVDVVGIVTSAVVAVWIVDAIQKRIDTQRCLRDHFAKELLEVRTEYRTLIGNLVAKKQKPIEIKNIFKKTNVHASDLLKLLKTQYGIDDGILYPFQVELQNIATECDEYIRAYKKDKQFEYQQDTLTQIQNFEKKYDHLFNDILVSIYNAKF